MARKSPRLAIVVQPAARRDQHQIWNYNAETYGPDHADRYLDFLNDLTAKLATDYSEGKSVPGCEGVQFVTLRKGRGAGHVAVYQVIDNTVQILRYFHTAQDWQGKTKRGGT